MIRPFLPVLDYRARGLLAMVAEMNKIENAARLAMGELGSELVVKSSQPWRFDDHEDQLSDRDGGRDRIDCDQPVLTAPRDKTSASAADQRRTESSELSELLGTAARCLARGFRHGTYSRPAADHWLLRRPVAMPRTSRSGRRCTKPPKIAIASCPVRSALSPGQYGRLFARCVRGRPRARGRGCRIDLGCSA